MSYSPEDLQLALELSSDHVKSVCYTAPAVRTVAVLTAALTHVTTAVSHVPRVHVRGPYGSGKSTFLSAIQPLVQNPVRNSGQLSSTYAYRNAFRSSSADGLVPVTIVDESKHIFKENGKGGSGHPLYAIMTEGYSKTGAPITYQEKDVNVTYSCYQVAFTASRGSQSLPEDVLERAIRLELTQKPGGLKLAQVTDPDVVSNGEQVGAFLRTAIQAAYKQLKVLARDTDWYAIHKLDNRTSDVWAALFAIAELAGGQWPSLIASAYAELGSKTSRNLPTAYQLKVDVLSFIHSNGTDADRIPMRDLISYLMELGRSTYTWDDAPFTVKRFGMTLKTAGVVARKSNGEKFYAVSGDWLKQADKIANPAVIEAEDPENDWDVLDEFLD